jgi:alpha-tubulin suppressor-like RCC1 family protein
MKLHTWIALLICLSSTSGLSASAQTAAPLFETANPAALVWSMIAAGSEHTCGLTPAGGVKCWGANEWGQLGDGTTSYRRTPVDVAGLGSGVTAISAGHSHTCALLAGGGVQCWGLNGAGQLGRSTTYSYSATPGAVSGLGNSAAAVAAGRLHTCALLAGGGVQCWGDNNLGQLGNGTNDNSLAPVDVIGLGGPVTAITAGWAHNCALAGGGILCWGDNTSGQLGNGTTGWGSNVPVTVSGLASGAAAVSAAGVHACALTSGGGAKCWGNNYYGQLGDGTNSDRSSPVDVSGLDSGLSAIAAGGAHTCALTSSGAARCWGLNTRGQLGNQSYTDSNTPVNVSSLAGAAAISAGGLHSCALLDSGSARCWGSNYVGQLGGVTDFKRNLPIDVAGLPASLAQIEAGNNFTCARTTAGGVKCWGNNYYYQLGDGSVVEWRPLPVDVAGLGSGVTAVSAGGFHACALTAGGGVKCWGNNFYGELGDGTYLDSATPVDVSGLAGGVTAITAGSGHVCALTAGGGVKCWGDNYSGQLGDGTNTRRPVPVDVLGLESGAAAIAAGGSHTCALLNSGGIQCWGYNGEGQLGDGSTTDRNSPVDVIGLGAAAAAIVTGGTHTCALTAGGGVKCWGDNNLGALGDGSTSRRPTPVDVLGLTSGVSALAAGGEHTCALMAGHSVKCWGYNGQGGLGNGATTDRIVTSPVDADGLAANVLQISAGGAHTCALVGGGRAKCWGDDFDGQLGVGAFRQSPVPVEVVDPVPLVTVNYGSGGPGSFITLTGWHFPPGSQISLVVNGHELTSSLAVNAGGSFIAFLDSSQAGLGGFRVGAGSGPEASAAFLLAAGLPGRLQEGGGQTFVLPGGIGEAIYQLDLPLIRR